MSLLTKSLGARARRHERGARPELDAITQFLDNGGVLLRFAGTRLAAGDDTHPDRSSSRRAPARRRVVVGDAQAYRAVRGRQPILWPRRAGRGHRPRQVLAEPETGLAEKTWARLADGTPLVTAERRGKGLDRACSTSPPTPPGRICRCRACSSTCCAESWPKLTRRGRAPRRGRFGEHGIGRRCAL